MSKKVRYIFLFIIVVSVLYYAEKYIDTQKKEPPALEEGTAKNHYVEFSEDFLPTSTTGAIIKHTYFTLSYSESHEQAEWVAYELSKNQLSQNEFERPYFVEDRDVKTGSAHWRNYKNSGYDRGHLCPAGDRRFSYQAYSETFLTSNISPQDHEFNARVWNYLEQKVRFWAKKYDGVFVITGGVLQPGLKTIGAEGVSVPSEFYKIIVDTQNGHYKVLAFLIPNQPTEKSFYDFVTTIDVIEAKTGIDFLHHLPDSLETELEASVDVKSWGKG